MNTLNRAKPWIFAWVAVVLAATVCPAARPATTRSAELPQPTRVTLRLKETPTSDALRQLFAHTRLQAEELNNPHFLNQLNDIPITADIIDQPFMQALLEICRKSSLEPTFTPMPERPVTLSLRRPRRSSSTRISATTRATTMRTSWDPSSPPRPSWIDGPTAVGGPFVFIASGATRNSQVDLESAGGLSQELSLNLMVLRDPALRLFGVAEKLIVDEAIDEAGRSLRLEPRPDDEATRPRATHESERLMIPVSASLAYTEQSRTLKRLRGRLNASIVARSEPIEIITDGASIADQKQAGKLRLTFGKLEETGDGARLMLTLHDYPPGPDTFNEVRALTGRNGFRVLDPAEGRYWIDSNIHSQMNNRIEGWIQFRPMRGPRYPGAPQPAPPPPKRPKKVVWDVPVEAAEVSIPFELHDLPLPARDR